MSGWDWDAYLKDKLKKYPHKDQAKQDALMTLRVFKDLKPELDTYVYNDGKRQQLVSLNGTIPVRYRGAMYNIPICIWLLETHPYIPPLVYVRPTSTMVIKPGRHVDNNGRVFLPYLTDWRSPQCSLHSLVQVLQSVFGEDPPVYAKSSSQPSRPAYPHGAFPQPTSQSQSHSTPYPSQPGGMPMPMPGHMPGYGSAGTRPPYRPAAGIGMPPYPSAGGASTIPPYPPSSGNPSMPPYPPTTSMSSSTYPTTSYQNTSQQPPFSSSGGIPPYSSTQQTSSSFQPPSYSATQPKPLSEINRQSSITDEAVRASLLSGVEDKLKRRVKEVYEQAKIEINGLQKTKSDLEEGSNNLDKIRDKLIQEQSVVDSNIQLLEQKNNELKQLIEKLESDADKMNIDEAVVTTTPLYNQIFNLFAEENAVEDAIYYLGEALRREVIDLEVFLKNVRSLSRQQFILRAQLKKARQTAGLNEMSAR